MLGITNTNLTSSTRGNISPYKTDALVMEWTVPSAAAGISKNWGYGSSAQSNRTFTIDWGDGSTDTHSSATVYYLTHTYAAAGTYIVQIYDQAGQGVELMRFGSGGVSYVGANSFVTDVLQWGSFSLDTYQKMFFDCDNLGIISATNIPDLSGTRFFTSMFENIGWTSGGLNKSMETWDTSNIQDMRYMFKYTGYMNSEYLIDQNDLTRSGWSIGGTITRTLLSSSTLPSGATGQSTTLTGNSGGSISQYGGSASTNSRLTNTNGGGRVFGLWAKRINSMGTSNVTLDINGSSATIPVAHTEGWKYITVSAEGSDADGDDKVTISSDGDIEVWGANLAIDGDTDYSGFNIGKWDVTGLTSTKGCTNMFLSNSSLLENWTISTKRYDQLLEGWGDQAGSVNSGVTLTAGNSKYTASSAAATGRAALIAAGWTITDGGTT